MSLPVSLIHDAKGQPADNDADQSEEGPENAEDDGGADLEDVIVGDVGGGIGEYWWGGIKDRGVRHRCGTSHNERNLGRNARLLRGSCSRKIMRNVSFIEAFAWNSLTVFMFEKDAHCRR